MNIKPEEITSIIKKEIERYEKHIQKVDSGTIIQIGDGIARVYGLDDCMEGELLSSLIMYMVWLLTLNKTM